MSGPVVVDDQATKPNSNIPVIDYFPPIPDGWVNQGLCIGCNITHPAAQELLYSTATDGTWTNAWWKTGQTRVTASLDFEGTSVAAYFVFFWRSEDPNSLGKGSLQFFIDSELKLIKTIDAADFTFQYDISPRTMMFQQSNLDPSKRHRFTAAWLNDGPRPRVAVALDSIEYIPSPTSPAAPTPSSPNPTSPTSPNITAIVAPIVSVVAALLLALGFFLWYRRRQRPLFPPGSPELDPFVETSEGRRYYNVTGPRPHTYPSTQPYQPGRHNMDVGGPYPGDLGSSEGQHTETEGDGEASRPPPYSEESTSQEERQELIPVALPHPQARAKSQLPEPRS